MSSLGDLFGLSSDKRLVNEQERIDRQVLSECGASSNSTRITVSVRPTVSGELA